MDETGTGVDVEAYYRRYGPMVLRRCRRLLRDEEAALDAAQDTFVQVLRRRQRLHDGAPSSLLWQVATRTCLNRIRAESRRPETAEEALLHRIAVASPSDRVDARHLLGRLFAREPDGTDVIATLHLHDGMTLEEVAEVVGLSVSGVRKRLRRLKARLTELEAGAEA